MHSKTLIRDTIFHSWTHFVDNELSSFRRGFCEYNCFRLTENQILRKNFPIAELCMNHFGIWFGGALLIQIYDCIEFYYPKWPIRYQISKISPFDWILWCDQSGNTNRIPFNLISTFKWSYIWLKSTIKPVPKCKMQFDWVLVMWFAPSLHVRPTRPCCIGIELKQMNQTKNKATGNRCKHKWWFIHVNVNEDIKNR